MAADGTIYVATSTVLTPVAGRDTRIVAGRTTVREGHPLLASHRHLFAPLVPTFEVEQVEQADAGAKRPAGAKRRGKPDEDIAES